MIALEAQTIAHTEAPLINAAPQDAFMREAAHQVALAAAAMCPSGRVLVLAGAGGNGGDGLYAGAELQAAGYQVQAVLLGSRCHAPALAAFKEAGGEVTQEPAPPALVIDAILGIGASGGLRPDAAAWVRRFSHTPTLSVDIPSGVHPDTGVEEGEVVVHADVTVTFGAPRFVHGTSACCGEVLVAELGAIGAALREVGEQGTAPTLQTYRAVSRLPFAPPPSLRTIGFYSDWPAFEPTASEHKYHGLAGMIAGSERYPGAGLLAAAGAIHTTSSMKHLVAPTPQVQALALQRFPELVCTDSIAASAQKVQAWLFGPGCTDAALLASVLELDAPLVIDAGGLNMLADHPLMLQRSKPTWILTPHAGEFARLAQALNMDLSPTLPGAQALARALGCTVLLKGRHTLITNGDTAISVDAGHGWLATPGSGDVLSGILVALLAKAVDAGDELDTCGVAAQAATLHARAGWLAAQTPSGPAPTTALRIAEHVPEATAQTR